jgi:hypothetical protein
MSDGIEQNQKDSYCDKQKSPKIITELTQEQIAQLSIYRDKWFKIQTKTIKNDGNCDKEKSQEIITQIYEKRGYNKPKFLWFDSPFAIIKFLKEEQGQDVSDVVSSFSFGNTDASWLGLYQYYQQILNIKFCEEFDLLVELSKTCGWWMAYENYAICSEWPEEINLNENNELHKDMGFALKFQDEEGLYFLNGVNMPKEYVMTPAEEIDCKKALLEENVEVRRELIRKIGIERILMKNEHDIIHSWKDSKGNEYDLVDLGIGRTDGVKGRYLKMTNPSIGVYHVEGVDLKCQTCQGALNWRNGRDATDNNYEEPIILT